MARHPFGLTASDWAFSGQTVDTTGNVAVLAGGATITYWSAQTGGTQLTDLALNADGSSPVDHVTSSDGSDGYIVGTIPLVYGPDGVGSMWASANGGTRVLAVAGDAADVAIAALNSISTVAGNLAAHSAAPNPHNTHLGQLLDVNTTGVLNGNLLGYDLASNTWKPVSSTGLNPADFVKTAGGSVLQIANGDVTTMGLKILIPAGDRTGPGAPNTLSFQWNAGTDLVPVYQETSRFNEYGEFRGQPSAVNRVFGRVKQINGSQTANLWEFTDNANNVLSFVSAAGLMRSPNLGKTLSFAVVGNISVGAGAHRIYNDTGTSLIIRSVRATVGTAPTGAAAIVDVNKNGTTIFTTQSHRPTIAISGNTSGKVTNMDVTSWADGEYLTVDVDQVGSTVAGANLVVQIDTY